MLVALWRATALCFATAQSHNDLVLTCFRFAPLAVQGVVLTVLGTLMQNRELLHYYKNLWACIGLEMEGSYYARQIERTIM